MSENIELHCPCCDALLVISRETGHVLIHKEKSTRRDMSLEAMVSELQAKKSDLSKRFEKEMEGQKDRGKLLEEKFREALNRAKKDDTE